tara:strand:+ start:929 stop:1687 length:759 start_codon:yes stop_codon:yes gene_type:complete
MEQYNLPENNPKVAYDMVSLPSGGIYYSHKKTALKVSYLTAADENILTSPNLTNSDDLMDTLLKSKILDKEVVVEDLAECDKQAIFIFLRNTGFGSEYKFTLTDPADSTSFEHTEDLSILKTKDIEEKPDEKGEFSLTLPVSKHKVKVRLLTPREEKELDELKERYKDQKISPLATKRLEKTVTEMEGERDTMTLSVNLHTLPLKDSHYIKNFIRKVTPGLDLQRTAKAPSGREVKFTITFGLSFFRTFFGI